MGELETKLGDLLKLERERLGKQLDDLSEALRIPEESLRAVEQGDVDSLPSTIYFGLFAKSYAESLGIDYGATVDAIKADLTHQVEEPKKGRKSKPATEGADSDAADETVESDEPAERPQWKKYAYIAAAVIIVVGGYFVIAQLLEDMRTGREPGKADTEETGTPGSAANTEAAYSTYDWNVPAYEPPDSLRLRLTPRGESWATIFADGDTAIFKKLVPGRVYNVAAQYRLRLSVAVPRMVEILLNGHEISPVSPETGRISRVYITQVNVDSFLNPPPVETEPTTDISPAAEAQATAPKIEPVAGDTARTGSDEL